MEDIQIKLKRLFAARNQLKLPLVWLQRRWRAEFSSSASAAPADLEARLERQTAALLAHLERQKEELCRLTQERSERMQEQFARMLSRIDERGRALSGLQQRMETQINLVDTHLREEEGRELETRGLFIIGCARSGTTIFANCLNMSKEVFLLQEADLFVNHRQDDFVGFYNARHRSYENLLRKGLYIPPAATPGRGAFDCLRRMSRRYRYVGEKVAIGPQPNDMGADWRDQAFDFFARYFYGSAYFLTLRLPAETLWSMKKKFPDRDAPALLQCWLSVTDFLIDMYLAFENTYLTFLDRLSTDRMEDVARILGLTLDMPPGMLDEQYKHSSLAPGKLPEFLRPHADLHDECLQLYHSLRENFCPRTFRYLHAENFELFHQVKRKLAQLLQETHFRQEQSRKAA